MAASKVAIECKVTFEKFLQSSPKALAKIEQIDFWDIEQFFPKTEQEVQIFKSVLSQCAALHTICFADCKLYELSVSNFRALAMLLLQCSKLKFLDVRHTVYPLLLHPTPDNIERFYAFCDAIGAYGNLTWLFFNGNFCKENINEQCFQYFINMLRRFKKSFNMQYGVNDFEMEHKIAINDIINVDDDSEEDLEESEGHDAISSVALHFDKKNAAENGFLKRRPEQVKTEELHEGVFLLSKVARYTIESEIKTQRRLKERAAYITIEDSAERAVVSHKKKVYVNPQHEAFVESANAHLGSGMYGEAVIIQNVLTGRWHCMKKLKRGTLRDREVEVLAGEGRILSSESMSDQDILINELIHGKNLKTIMQEIAQKKLSFFEEARERNANLTEVYESPFNEIFSFEEALALNISLVEAFESLHRKGYVHGDIKPDNVMRDLQKKCVAVDFGGTKKAGEDSRWGGAFAYAAPEAFSLNSATPKHDIYSMGMVAGRILALAIDNIGLHIREDRVNYYEKLSLDTHRATQERYHYLKEIFKLKYPECSEIETFIDIYLGIFPVIFGAKDTQYQEQKKLSAEAIALCRLIYRMTEPLEHRPETNEVLEEMRKIRLDHINNRMIHFVPVLRDNYNYFRGCLSNAPHALDDLDSFILRVVDVNENNRPSIEMVKQYLQKLDNTLQLKRTLNTEMQARWERAQNNFPFFSLANSLRSDKPRSKSKSYFVHVPCSKEPDNTPVLETKQSAEIQEKSPEVQESCLDKENVKPESSNGTFNVLWKRFSSPTTQQPKQKRLRQKIIEGAQKRQLLSTDNTQKKQSLPIRTSQLGLRF